MASSSKGLRKRRFILHAQGQGSVDNLLLTLLAATTKQNNHFQTVFRKIDAIAPLQSILYSPIPLNQSA